METKKMVMDTKKESKLFKTNPIAKQVRTPKFKPQVIKNKKIYNRKRNDNG
jgi:hypothetical protein|tara:strand:+ start:311 stop:463 length:153 start_codon:yes stop_codon:yes gene_type:complete